jgi:hypothetical protein
MHTAQLHWFSWFHKPPLLSLLSLPLPAGPCCLLVLLMFLAEFTLLGLEMPWRSLERSRLKGVDSSQQAAQQAANLEQQQQVDL